MSIPWLVGISALFICILFLAVFLHVLNLRKKIAKEENKSKRNFLAMVSHEIRTPINVITGMTEVLLRKAMPQDVREDVREIKQAGDSLVSIIDNILDLSKIDADKLKIFPVNYQLSQEIETKALPGAKEGDGNIPFTVSGCRFLVVDDLPSNLKVAEALLKPYQATVDTCLSGAEAIELVKMSHQQQQNYDIIFMDHMMPKMDGLEATAAIRAWEKEQGRKVQSGRPKGVPIVALTANVLAGMREFYLEQGFQDYIKKPINSKHLDETINRLIPIEKKTYTAASHEPVVSVNITSELEAQRLDILNHYRVSFNSRTKFDIVYFNEFGALVNTIDTENLSTETRQQAALLKEAALHEDAAKIQETLPAFCEALHQHQKAGGTVESMPFAKTKLAKTQNEKTSFEILLRLKEAIQSEDTETTEAIMGELGTIDLEPSGRKLFFLLYDLLLAGDTEKALGAINLWERLRNEE